MVEAVRKQNIDEVCLRSRRRRRRRLFVGDGNIRRPNGCDDHRRNEIGNLVTEAQRTANFVQQLRR